MFFVLLLWKQILLMFDGISITKRTEALTTALVRLATDMDNRVTNLYPFLFIL